MSKIKALDIYIDAELVGNLLQNQQGQILFSYAQTWLQNPAAYPLSQSLPLRAEQFTQKECKGFFMGLLPEESQRKIIALNLGISANNDFSMLQALGGECAGAITFLPENTKPILAKNYAYKILDVKELSKVLTILPTHPLLAGEKDVRLSLAGAQTKLAVIITSDNQIAIPLDSAPSTHILKPESERFAGLIFNEDLCMKLAAVIGLNVAKTEIRFVENMPYLLIERYDRKLLKNIKRLHQEDFCQALGIPSNMKYQNEGGPSLKQCFNLLRETASNPVRDLQALLDAVIFNYLIGNHDAHGKNFSLLYDRNESGEQIIKLAPLYDLICTTYYSELSKKMAMKIGGEYSSLRITPRNFEKLAEEIGFAKPLVKQRLAELTVKIILNLATIEIINPNAGKVAEHIMEHCKLLQTR